MPSKTQPGLGRGFDSLLPQSFDSSILVEENERVQKISIKDITPNKHQPRQYFDEGAINELAESIKRHGVLQPLVLTAEGDKYMLVAGERRWRASKIAGLNNVPAIVRSAEDIERLEIALIENVQREDLSPLEQAQSIQRLHDQFNVEIEDIAKRLGKAKTTVHNVVRLLGLTKEAKEALNSKKITEGHARAVLAMRDAKGQNELLNLIIKNGWSVRQAESYANASRNSGKTGEKAHSKVESETPETKKLGKHLGTKVTIRRMAKGGKLEIAYSSDTELSDLINRLSK